MLKPHSKILQCKAVIFIDFNGTFIHLIITFLLHMRLRQMPKANAIFLLCFTLELAIVEISFNGVNKRLKDKNKTKNKQNNGNFREKGSRESWSQQS